MRSGCARARAGDVRSASPEHRTDGAGPETLVEESPALAEVAKVVRDFGRKRALDGVTLRLHAGEIHPLLGPNGAGKTTLVRLLAGLVTPTSGRVCVAGV